GAKRTVRSTDLPATMVIGATSETTVKAAPLLATELIVRSAEPALLRVSVTSLIWPVFTLPKSSDGGVTEIEGASPAVPVPLRARVTVDGAGSLLVTDSVRDTAPAAFGENRTVTLADCPAGIASGSAGAVTLNRGLLLVMELTVSAAAPLAPIVNVRSFVWPTLTLP